MPFDNTPQEIPTNAQEISIVDDMVKILATPDKWCKNALTMTARDGTVSHRILGAWLEATDHKPCVMWHTATDSGSKVLQHLSAMTLPVGISSFNNDPATTHEDVLNFLSHARTYFS